MTQSSVLKRGHKVMKLRKLVGQVDNMAASEVGELKTGTFKITVSDDAGAEVFSNDKAEFQYREVSSLSQVLESEGAKLEDSQVEFLAEALKSSDEATDKKNGEAVKAIVDIYNSSLKANAKSAAYQKIVNQYKPETEDTLEMLRKRMVSDYIRTKKVSEAEAVKVLTAAGII